MCVVEMENQPGMRPELANACIVACDQWKRDRCQLLTFEVESVSKKYSGFRRRSDQG